MRWRNSLIALLALPGVLCATDLKPWLTPDMQFRYSVNELVQFYQTIETPNKCLRYHSVDSFTTLGLELSGFSYSGELEVTIANTRRQFFGCDNIRFTARYQLLDDILGDFVSAVAGVTVTQAFTNSLHDPSSFHHGILEAEAHFSVGQESICLDTWRTRWWGVAGIGCGDHGSPWLHGFAAWEINALDTRYFRIFAETLWGLGRNNFSFPFRGYGSIRHQSVDLGGRFTYIFDIGAELSLEYSFRVYARNFPNHTNRFQLKFEYPFCYVPPFLGRGMFDQNKDCEF